jgi:transcriptional regulator with XRE-family HTH domain
VSERLFSALLKYWRAERGLSQLDLALHAEVTPRHVSFLETGRAKPSETMVLRLMDALRVPLRDQNEALRAAGFPPRFEEPAVDALAPEIDAAIAQMMEQHEPYPLTLIDLGGAILRANQGARRVFGAFLAEPNVLPSQPDMVSLIFDPRLMRPFVLEWPALARQMVSRLHREHLTHGDARVAHALAHALSFPGVPSAWRTPDFGTAQGPAFTIRVTREAMRAAFLVTTTTFSAPQQVTLEELRIESCFPLDEETRDLCRRLALTSDVQP